MKVGLCAVSHSVYLFPLYYYGNEPDSDIPFSLEFLTIGNLGPSNSYLYLSLVSIYVTSFYVLYLLVKEYVEYTARRQEFLSRDALENYTVVVENLPKSFSSSDMVFDLMESMLPSNVELVNMPIPLKKLRKLLGQREKARGSLEHFMALEQSRKENSSSGCCLNNEKLASKLEVCYKRLDDLNVQVANEIETIENGPPQTETKQKKRIVVKVANKQGSVNKVDGQPHETTSGSGQEAENGQQPNGNTASQGESPSGGEAKDAVPTENEAEEGDEQQSLLSKEKEKVKQLPLRKIKEELAQRSIDVSTFYEKSQFINSLAEARVKEQTEKSKAKKNAKEAKGKRKRELLPVFLRCVERRKEFGKKTVFKRKAFNNKPCLAGAHSCDCCGRHCGYFCSDMIRRLAACCASTVLCLKKVKSIIATCCSSLRGCLSAVKKGFASGCDGVKRLCVTLKRKTSVCYDKTKRIVLGCLSILIFTILRADAVRSASRPFARR